MRIAVGGILHETNTFADGLTELAAFETPGAFPGLLPGSGGKDFRGGHPRHHHT
jgi:microcystin degradation protein MlrC